MNFGEDFINCILIMAILSGILAAGSAFIMSAEPDSSPRWRWAATYAVAMAVAIPLLVARLAAVSGKG